MICYFCGVMVSYRHERVSFIMRISRRYGKMKTTDWNRYEEQVYAGLLGKVTGVYFGRPVEGWTKQMIQEKFGSLLDHYCAKEQNVPLIVTDDDISGTFTFIRALEDSGLYAATPDRFFGDTWLNYLLEGKTILWWGGMFRSTEHTAYLRLKHGIPSPESGSITLNTKVVAEQIGAQIFIDAFGLVCPNNPELAAELAGKAARVSHDGEAVYAAQVVTAMAAAAFDSTLTMDQVLDLGVSVIPADSLIAQLHREVRAWCKEDCNWEKTYDRIAAKYGYDKFGGGCHVVPNHAVMVMAWAYGQKDFHKTMQIITTAGWDTDCNAANVGTVTGLLAGIESMKVPYDYLTPFSDRVYIPTAEGTYSCTDVANEAFRIAAIGRKIANAESVKPAHLFHFSLPYSTQGFMGGCKNENGKLVLSGKTGDRVMRPVMIPDSAGGNTTYKAVTTPLFYPGMKLEYAGAGLENIKPVCKVIHAGDLSEEVIDTAPLATDAVAEAGFEFVNDGSAVLDYVDFSGQIKMNAFPDGARPPCGWIDSMSATWGMLTRNEGFGVYVTGGRFWKNVEMSCRYSIHAADSCGLLICYQGQKRFYALEFAGGTAKIQRHYYDDVTVLAEMVCPWEQDEWKQITLSAKDGIISAAIGGHTLSVCDNTMTDGGCGFFAEMATCAVQDVEITADFCSLF